MATCSIEHAKEETLMAYKKAILIILCKERNIDYKKSWTKTGLVRAILLWQQCKTENEKAVVPDDNKAIPKIKIDAPQNPTSIDTLVRDLFHLGSVNFGSFKLKSGMMSPVYIDLRLTISRPKLLKQMSQMMWTNLFRHIPDHVDLICGVPYTALPFATCMSIDHQIPLVIKRKEGAKDHGTKKAIEGIYSTGQSCVIIEDLVTTGGSVLEVVQSLRDAGLVVNDVIVFLDREQGAKKELEKHDLKLHSVITFTEMLRILEEYKLVDDATVGTVKTFIATHQVDSVAENKNTCNALKKTNL